MNEQPIEYRIRKKNRYPWWVKTVDQITTKTDESRHVKPDFDSIMYHGLFEAEEAQRQIDASQRVVAKAIEKNIPGRSLRDLALHSWD